MFNRASTHKGGGFFNLVDMYRIKDILPVFKKRVCLFRPYEYSGDLMKQISPALLRKDVPVSVLNLHPLITMDNISAIAPDFSDYRCNYPAYNPLNSYYYGDVVYVDSHDEQGNPKRLFLKALVDTPNSFNGASDFNEDFGGEPALTSRGWAVTTPFSEWVDSKLDNSIRRMIQNFIRTKLIKGETRLMCEHKCLFEGSGRLVDREKNKNNLVGFEINSVRSSGVTTKIDKIGLQFTKKGVYKLYLMHSSSTVPVRVITVEKKTDASFEWFSFDDLYLPYSSETVSPGGSWYLCYDQTEIPEGSEAIIKNRDWSKGPCGTCSRSEYLSWQAWSKYIEIHPFSVNKENVMTAEDKPQMWDQFFNLYDYNTNYGLNLEVSVDCDITEIITRNASAFDEVLGLQIAGDWLNEFMYNANARTNRNSLNAGKTDIILALEGDNSQATSRGLVARLNAAYKAVNVAFDSMDRVCMTCTNNGIKYYTV